MIPFSEGSIIVPFRLRKLILSLSFFWVVVAHELSLSKSASYFCILSVSDVNNSL